MKIGQRLPRLRNGANPTRWLTSRLWRREIPSLPTCQTKSSRVQERTEADHLSRFSNNGRTSRTELAVVEPETGEALEVVVPLTPLKVVTEVAVLVTQRVDVEAEAVVEVEAASTRQKDHQHQLRQHPLQAIPEHPLLEFISRCSVPKVYLPRTSSLVVTQL
jgi:hypothetical protein